MHHPISVELWLRCHRGGFAPHLFDVPCDEATQHLHPVASQSCLHSLITLTARSAYFKLSRESPEYRTGALLSASIQSPKNVDDVVRQSMNDVT